MRVIKKIVKTYIALEDLHLSTEVVDINMKAHRIAFQNGIKNPTRLNGRYTTDNSLIQEAIERDNEYGIKFDLYAEGEYEIVIGGKEVEPVKVELLPVDEGEGEGEVLEDVFGAQEAREYLKERFPEVEDAEISNTDKMVAFAKAKGIKLPNIRKKRE